jgi:hypothetical protein
MAQTIKLKRSATQNAVPSTSSLALGELAINTYDGKLFIKKDVSGTESIVTIGEVGANSIGPTELASTAVTAGSYGSTSAIPVITIDADGRITSASTATISGLSANSVTSTEIAANAVGISELNVSDGTDGQVLTTDGSGNLAFEDQSGGAASATAFSTNIASGDGSTTAFTLSESPSAESKIIAFINGVFQNQDAYTISGTTLTFDTAPISGTNNVVVYVIGDVYSGESVLISNFSGNGTTTAFTLANNPGNENNTQVYIDGVYQQKTTYSVSGTTLTFSSAPPTGTNNIEVVMLTSTTVNTPAAGSVVTASMADDSVTASKIVSSAVTTAKIADSNVTTAKIADDAVTIGKIADAALVIESEGISSNDNDTTLPTSAAVKDYVDTQVAGKDALSELSGDTDDVSEGSSNLYYTDARVGTYISGNRTYGNITTTGYLAGPSTFTIDPAAVGDNTGTLVIAGNLQVDGTTTTINSTTMTVDDLNLTLASGAANAAAANGAGITVDGASATLLYQSTSDAWSFNKNVGIGTTSPVGKLSISDSGATGVEFSPDDSNARVQQLYYDRVDNAYRTSLFDAGDYQFRISGTERMRIDSSGNLLVGATSAYGTTGTTINAAGLVYSSASGDRAGQFDRTTSDGEIVRFSKAGTTVGSISVSGVDFIIDSPVTDSAMAFQWDDGGTTRKLQGYQTAFRMNTANDADVDLGGSNSRWKDLYLSNAIYLGSGTGTTMSYISDYEDDLYIYNKESAGKLFLGTNNTTKVTIDSSGNVGIGTDSLDYKLHIEGAGNNLKLSRSGVREFAMGVASGGSLVFEDKTAAAERMRIDSSGNVGIGTAAPYGRLELKGNGNTWTTAPAIRMWDDLNSKGWLVGSANNLSPGDFYIRTLPSISGNPGATEQEFTIKHSTGNVGIGTTSPSSKLQIMGGTSGVDQIHISSNLTDNTIKYAGIIMTMFTNNTAALLGAKAENGNTSLLYGSSGTDHRGVTKHLWYTNSNYNSTSGNTERMRIDSSGKLLIGDSASHTDDLLQIETPASGGGHGIQIRRNDSNGDQGIGRIMFGNNNDTDLATISSVTDGQADCARLVFSTQPTSGNSTERMRIDSSGNVGIGSTTSSLLNTRKFNVFSDSLNNDGVHTINYNGANTYMCAAHYMTGASSTPYHDIKTNISCANESIMYRVHVTGYNYGTAETIDLHAAAYAYAAGNSHTALVYQNQGTDSNQTISIYKSSDNFSCIKIYLGTSSYYAGFVYHFEFAQPTGYNKDFEITSDTFSGSSSNQY